MEIKSFSELLHVLNYENKCRKMPRISGFIGWMWFLLLFFIHPGNPTYFAYCLRCEEYFNGRGGVKKLIAHYLHYKHKKLQFRTGIELYPGCADIGVRVNHGKCVVSKAARIGRDSVILSDVTIGGEGGARDDGAAIIGERVFLSTGVKIIGKISICNDVVIGANAVVTKDITEPGTVWVGIPARKIGNIGDRPLINRID